MSMITIDAHLDTPWIMFKHGEFDLSTGIADSKFNYPLAKAGGLNGAIFALYLSDAIQDQLGPHRCKELIKLQLEWIQKQERPDFKIMFGMEGGRLINRDLDYLTQISGNLIYLTLTHNRHTSWCDSATDLSGNVTGSEGLTRFGREVIRHCNKLGVLVDISHVADKSALVALDISEDPVIASHSGCKKVLSHPRNLTDELINLIACTGGVVGVPFARKFVGPTVDDVFKHIDHVASVVGIDHVGIGSDIDGADMVNGVSNVADWSRVFEIMTKKGYKQQDIEKVAGGNWLRVIEEGA